MSGMFLIFVLRLELEWTLALLVVLLIYLMFTVLSRLAAESGLLFLQSGWVPLGVLMGLLGVSSLGPQAILVVGVISCILVIDPRECLMPFMVTGLKICETTKVKPAKVGLASPIVFVLGLAVALPVVLWSNYEHGMPLKDNWGTRTVPTLTFDAGTRAINDLQSNDQLEIAENRGPLGRLSGIWEHHPRKTRFLVSLAVGFILVVLVSFLRLRYTWWPIHPIPLPGLVHVSAGVLRQLVPAGLGDPDGDGAPGRDGRLPTRPRPDDRVYRRRPARRVGLPRSRRILQPPDRHGARGVSHLPRVGWQEQRASLACSGPPQQRHAVEGRPAHGHRLGDGAASGRRARAVGSVDAGGPARALAEEATEVVRVVEARQPTDLADRQVRRPQQGSRLAQAARPAAASGSSAPSPRGRGGWSGWATGAANGPVPRAARAERHGGG